MKNKKLKIFGIIFAVLIIIFAGVMSYASSKLNPEEIKKMALAQTQKIFPNSTADLESVNIKWGLNFRIELKKFLLKTKNSEGHPVELAYVDSLDVKVPLWAIVTNGGVIEIQLDKPVVNYQEFEKDNNWTYALGEKAVVEQVKDVKEEVQVEKESPNPALGLLAKSKINVRLSDVLIKYFLKDKSSGQVTISRFLIKGLNLEESTAFEIATDAKFKMANASEVSLSALAIGEINIAELINKGEVSSLVIVKLNNIKKSDLDMKFPEITTNLNLLVKKTGELSGKVETSFESNNKISANFVMAKSIEISDINVNIILKDIGTILGLDRSIDLSKSKLEATGSFNLSEAKKINANLDFVVTPGIGLNIEGVNTTTSMRGSYKGDAISIRSSTNLFNGTVDVALDGEFDLGENFDLNKLKPFKINVLAKKLNIPEKFIQEKLWSKKDPAVVAKADAAKKEDKEGAAKAGAPLVIPPGVINLSWSEIVVANENFSGNGKINLSSKELVVDNLKFNFSKGTGSLNQTLKFGTTSNVSNFNFDIKSLNLDSFKGFLPPFVENFSGTFSGKVNGQAIMYTSHRAPSFNINAALEAVNGEIKDINLKDFVGPLLAGIPLLNSIAKDKDLDVGGKFESLSLKGNFTDSAYKLDSVKMLTKNKTIEVSGSGLLVPDIKKNGSVMDVVFIDNGKIGEKIKQSIGSRELPMRLEGPGFSLKPDIGYTLGKIAKTAAETKGKEALKKVIDKNLDKVIPADAKDKVKDLLNGFLKKK